MVGLENSFTPSDLLKYAESLIKETRQLETKYLDQSIYSWLKSREVRNEQVFEEDLEVLRPMVQKLSPESCSAIAVKLDLLTEHITSTNVIFTTLRNLLEEEDNVSMMLGNVKRAKKKRVNKVHPVLAKGRTPTVSFVLTI